ncbi:MAG: acylneuraminate cytidylyltransferase family protein [Pseudomonadota bacterium]
MSRRRLALLPARGGSKRITDKNILPFHGKPMLAHPLAAAEASSLFDLIHVSTDSERIASVARDLGADVSFMRPTTLADDVTGILPVAKWCVETFAERGEKFDDVCILFPAAPMLEPEDLIGAFEVYAQHNATRNLISVAEAPVYLEWYYHRGSDGRLTPTHPGGAFMPSQSLAPVYYETGTFTIFSAEYLTATESFDDDANYVSYELDAWKAVDIDTPKDLAFASRLYETWKRETV